MRIYLVIMIPFAACGCIPYAFPSLAVTPLVNVKDCAEDVHVFRVDVASQHGAPIYGHETYALSRVPLVAGRVPPQVQVGLDRGVIIIHALSYHFHYHDGVRVRLYRPGYELVEFDSWQLGKSIDWKPAKSLDGHVKAIDDLLARPGTADTSMPWTRDEKRAKRQWTPHTLNPGSYSEAHRATLSFAAAEYERLAAAPFPDVSEALRQRLRQSCDELRAHIAK